jgi:hypothetical protein
MRQSLLEQRSALQGYGSTMGDVHRRRAIADEMWPRTMAILNELSPDLARLVGFPNSGWNLVAVKAVSHALGVLEHRDAVERYMGAPGPHLDAAGLHALVWSSAAPLWSVSYQDALNAAARAVNARIRQKSQSNLNDVELTNDVFSFDPPKADRRRLRFDGPRDHDSWRSRMNGARGLGQACFQGVRNIGSHEEAAWAEQEALEYLAMFSVLMRWVDACDVESVQ